MGEFEVASFKLLSATQEALDKVDAQLARDRAADRTQPPDKELVMRRISLCMRIQVINALLDTFAELDI